MFAHVSNCGSVVLRVSGVAFAAFAFWAAPAHAKPHYTIIDFGYQNWLLDINNSGIAVGGWCPDYRGNPVHGLISSPKGAVTTFDPPGAIDTYVRRINDGGAVIGYYSDAATSHGFIRAADGSFTVIDVPGAIATFSSDVNNAGVSIGGYTDSNDGRHAFVRTVSGKFTRFNERTADRINDNGFVAGTDQTGQPIIGYIRAPDGGITYFAPPAATSTAVNDMNNGGTIVGSYFDGNANHGFFRTPDGNIATIDVPGAIETEALGIDENGDIVGAYAKRISEQWHRGPIYKPFLRTADGTIETFHVPHQRAKGWAVAINNAGAIAGYYQHRDCCLGAGYIRTP